MPNYFIQLKGKFNIPEALEVDTNLVLGLEVEVDSAEKKSNKNGEYDYTFKCPALRGEVVTKLGKKIKFEKKSSQSQKLNGQIRMIALEQGKDEDKEYETKMTLLRHFWPMVDLYLEQLNKDENGL